MEENVAVNRSKDEASGGRLGEVNPKRFIKTFCACNAGFVARWWDFFAKRSLRLITGGSCGVLALRRGGVAARAAGEAALQTVSAKSETTFLTGVLVQGDSDKGGAKWDPRKRVTFLLESGEGGDDRSPWATSKRTDS